MGASRLTSSLSFLLLCIHCSQVRGECSKQEYQYCVKLADPLLKDPHLIYPDNSADIEHVCRTWSFFVDCVKLFTEKCFSEIKKQEFNKAVEHPVDSIHKLCSMPEYRQDYMKHASCMKMTLTEDSHCGRHYRHLVAQVSGEAPRASICCSHYMFRECVLDQTKNSCEADAAPFSAQMLDKALSFLREQCANFIPNRVDCPGGEFYSGLYNDQMSSPGGQSSRTTMVRSSSQVTIVTPARTTYQPMPSVHQPTTRPYEEKVVSNSGGSDWDMESTGPTWMPGGGRGRSSESTAMAGEGELTRVTYGRGMTVGGGVGGVRGSGGASSPPIPAAPTSPSVPLWFPSSRPSDMMKENAIDEPNQQGLSDDDSSAPRLPLPLFTTLIASLLLMFR